MLPGTKNLLGTYVDQRTGLPLLASEGPVVAGAAAAAGAAAEDIAEPAAVEVVAAAADLDDGTLHQKIF